MSAGPERLLPRQIVLVVRESAGKPPEICSEIPPNLHPAELPAWLDLVQSLDVGAGREGLRYTCHVYELRHVGFARRGRKAPEL